MLNGLLDSNNVREKFHSMTFRQLLRCLWTNSKLLNLSFISTTSQHPGNCAISGFTELEWVHWELLKLPGRSIYCSTGPLFRVPGVVMVRWISCVPSLTCFCVFVNKITSELCFQSCVDAALYWPDMGNLWIIALFCALPINLHNKFAARSMCEGLLKHNGMLWFSYSLRGAFDAAELHGFCAGGIQTGLCEFQWNVQKVHGNYTMAVKRLEVLVAISKGPPCSASACGGSYWQQLSITKF